MSDKEVLDRKERAELVITLAQSIYSAHIQHGRPFATIAEAITMAATIVGLALSDKLDALTLDASLHPDAHRKALDALAVRLNRDGAADQDRRAMRVVEAMGDRQKTMEPDSDRTLPCGPTPAV